MSKTQNSGNFGAVLFICTYNAIRSPMAEGLAKWHLGKQVYLQSAGVKSLELDPMVVDVLSEWEINIAKHHSRPFDRLFDESFDCVITLSEPARKMVEQIRENHIWATYHWDVLDPTRDRDGKTRNQQLDMFRELRDQLSSRIKGMFPQGT